VSLLQHHAKVTVALSPDETNLPAGVTAGQTWEPFRSKSGGGKMSDAVKIRPGGMAPPVAATGTYDYEDLTVQYVAKHGTDSGLLVLFNSLHARRFAVIVQPLDARGQAGFHKPETYGGVLIGSTPPDIDADSNDAQVLELTFAIDSNT
jgi:hypothetical protein